LTVEASSVNEHAESASPNSSALEGASRPEATGRPAVREPIRRSMSRSRTWLSALAPPQASARPIIVTANRAVPGQPRAPTTMPHAPVTSSRLMILGFVSVR
jgi:hypothetical protein